MRPLPVLLLSDDRPGHYHLAEGVVAAVQRVRPVQVTKVSVRRTRWLPGRVLAELLMRGAPPESILRWGYGIDAAKLLRGGLVVSAGGETLVANAAAAHLLGAPNIFCGTLRRLPPEAFSLVISSYARHAALPRHLVALKPSGIDPDTLDRRPETRLDPALGPKLAGLLIGGNSGHFHYEPAEWQALLGFLHDCRQAHGMQWVVSTSRRTPPDVGDALEAMATRTDSPIARLIDFRTAGPGTLLSLFACTQAILCTEDSSTMLSEAVCARLPVVGVSPARHGFKDEEQEYRQFLRDRNWCRFLPLSQLTPERFIQLLRDINPLEDNHLDRLAAEMQARLPRLFQ